MRPAGAPEADDADVEVAGCGVPAADLALDSLNPAYYWSIVKQFWPHLDLQEILLLANIGRIFRLLAAIGWASWSLEQEWANKSMKTLKLYHSWMSAAIQAAEWED